VDSILGVTSRFRGPFFAVLAWYLFVFSGSVFAFPAPTEWSWYGGTTPESGAHLYCNSTYGSGYTVASGSVSVSGNVATFQCQDSQGPFGSYQITAQGICLTGASYNSTSGTCVPAICTANVGQFTRYSGPLLNVTSEQPFPYVSTICHLGCVLIVSTAGRTCIQTMDGVDMCGQSGMGQMTTDACPEGTTVAASIEGTFSPSSTASGSSGLSSSDSAAVAATSANTLAAVTALDRIRTSSDLTITGAFGDCSSGYSCSGDVMRCSTLLASRQDYCRNKPTDIAADGALQAEGSALLAETPETIRAALKAAGATVDVSQGFNRPRFLSGTGCPAPLSFTVLGVSHAVDLQPFCDLAPIFSMFLLVTSAVVSLRIFTGGLA